MTITIPFNKYANDFLEVLDRDNCVFATYTHDLARPNAIGLIIGVALVRTCWNNVPDKFVM